MALDTIIMTLSLSLSLIEIPDPLTTLPECMWHSPAILTITGGVDHGIWGSTLFHNRLNLKTLGQEPTGYSQQMPIYETKSSGVSRPGTKMWSWVMSIWWMGSAICPIKVLLHPSVALRWPTLNNVVPKPNLPTPKRWVWFTMDPASQHLRGRPWESCARWAGHNWLPGRHSNSITSTSGKATTHVTQKKRNLIYESARPISWIYQFFFSLSMGLDQQHTIIPDSQYLIIVSVMVYHSSIFSGGGAVMWWDVLVWISTFGLMKRLESSQTCSGRNRRKYPPPYLILYTPDSSRLAWWYQSKLLSWLSYKNRSLKLISW